MKPLAGRELSNFTTTKPRWDTTSLVIVHFCSVDFSDFFGFAMKASIDGASLVVMDASKEGTVPYDVITTGLTPHGKAIASSHTFFFADTEGRYYPKFPTKHR